MTITTELAQREKFEAWALSDNDLSTTLRSEIYAGIAWLAWMAACEGSLDALAAKDKQNLFLKEQLEQLANFNPDWDRLEAANDSLREHAAELKAARERIAELEEIATDYGMKFQRAQDALKYAALMHKWEARPEQQPVTVNLPVDEDGNPFGFARWANTQLPGDTGTMTISRCEDAWRAAFAVFSAAAGITIAEGE